MGNCIQVLLSQNGAMSACLKEEHGNQLVDGKAHPIPSWNPLYCGIDSMIDELTTEFSPPIPPKMSPDEDDDNDDDDDGILKPRSVKIVVTKKQLDKLLKSMKELEAAGTKVHLADSLWEDGRSRYKWRPSLATITE